MKLKPGEPLAIVLTALRDGQRLRVGFPHVERPLANAERLGLIELFPLPRLTAKGLAAVRDLPALEPRI